MDLRELPSGKLTRHPWEVARARFFADLLVRHATAPVEVLDVGAGDGYASGILLRQLPEGSSAVCYDPNYEEDFLHRARENGSPGLTFTAERPDRRFDLLLALDVLEHVEDDDRFLRTLVEGLVRPGGTVLLSVPAWPALFTRHDVMLGHHRRYRPSQLERLAREAGLEQLSRGGLFHSLLLPRALTRALELLRSSPRHPPGQAAVGRADTATGRWKDRPRVSRLVSGWLAWDNRVSGWLAQSGVCLPGLSTWWLGRRP